MKKLTILSVYGNAAYANRAFNEHLRLSAKCLVSSNSYKRELVFKNHIVRFVGVADADGLVQIHGWEVSGILFDDTYFVENMQQYICTPTLISRIREQV